MLNPSLVVLYQTSIYESGKEQVLTVRPQLQATMTLHIFLGCCNVFGEDLLGKVDIINEIRETK